MSDIPTSDATRTMQQTNDDQSVAMENLSVITNNSDKSSPPKSFSDMPLDVVGLFIERSDYKEQLILRKVCKSLRSLIDKQKPSCTSLDLRFYPNKIHFKYNRKSVFYAPPKCQEIGQLREKAEKEGNIKLIVREDFEKIALDDLASTLKNPKLQLKIVVVYFDALDNENSSEFAKRFHRTQRVFESIGQQISAKICGISTDQSFEYHSILRYLKPGVLETIGIRGKLNSTSEAMKQISLLDQWKQATRLKLLNSLGSFPLEYATHFKQFHFKKFCYSGNHLILLREFASKLETFEYCVAEYHLEIPAQAIHRKFGHPAPPNDRTDYVSHYPIPNSDDYLEFQFFKKSIKIKKIKQ